MKNKKPKIIKWLHKSFFKLNIFETQIFKTFEPASEIIRVVAEIWAIARIVFAYHVKRKKILIISPIDFNISKSKDKFSSSVYDFLLKSFQRFKILLKSTQHIMIPAEAWTNGLLTNPESCIRLFKKQKPVNKKLVWICREMKSNISLVIIVKSLYADKIVNECFSKRIPVIVFKDSISKLKLRSSYEIEVNFRFTQLRYIELLFWLLSSIIKKKNYTIGTISWGKSKKKRYARKKAWKKYYQNLKNSSTWNVQK